MQQINKICREKLMSLVILSCLSLTILTSFGVNLLDVKILNIELIDRELYSVITEKGNVNIHPNDILRIERSYTKESLTGEAIELDKIYTEKGFVYVTSKSPYAAIGQKLMNAVDFYGLSVWERPDIDWETVKKYGYSVGMPLTQIPVLFLLISLQYAALSLGGIVLIALVFPLRLEEEERKVSLSIPLHEQEKTQEEPLEIAAK